MTSTHRRRGFVSEEFVAAAFAADGFPHAEPAPRGTPGRDILGLPGVCVEVKARTGFEPLANMRQAVRNAGGDLPLIVLRCNGQGPASIDDWPAFMPFGVVRRLLRLAGYGDPLPGAEDVS